MEKILFCAEPDFKSKDFKTAFAALKEAGIASDAEIQAVINIYEKAKDLTVRNTCLKLLYNKTAPQLQNFFDAAYKKERSLDMKINALRGLAHFISEEETERLLIPFNEKLKQRGQATPHNFQEYEFLLGKHALPYLVDKYGYKCLKETLAIVQKEYDDMPDGFKGHFTTDENGETVLLRSPEESRKMMADFFRFGT